MRFIRAATAALFILSVFALPASADPGEYWLDVCHDTGADTIVYDNFSYELTCSSDPWVQGYGGTGVEAYVLVQVEVYNPQGEQVAEFNQGLRPTGANVQPESGQPSDWVGAEYDVVIVDLYDEGDICVSGFCNPDIPGVPVVIPRDAWVDTDRQRVEVKNDGHENWVLVDVCAYPFPGSPRSCNEPAVDSSLFGDG